MTLALTIALVVSSFVGWWFAGWWWREVAIMKWLCDGEKRVLRDEMNALAEERDYLLSQLLKSKFGKRNRRNP